MPFCLPNIKTEKHLILLFLLVFNLVSITSSGQNVILFMNTKSGVVLKAKPGDQISVLYKGYLGQTEYYKHTLFEIKDSTFILGNPLQGKGSQSLLPAYKEIKYSDVIAFRRMGIGRTLLKSTLSLGAAIGTLLVLDRLYTNNQVNNFAKIGISMGVGLGLRFGIDALLPEKPKYFIKDGWELKAAME